MVAMPSRHRIGRDAEGEGFGLAYVEAGARGLPVVAGYGGGTEETVEDGVSGLLVDPEDTQHVAATIVRVLSDPELATTLGEGGRELARSRFSSQAFRERVERLVYDLNPRGLVR